MATKPVRILDAFGRPASRGNVLYDSARWDRSRPQVWRVDRDLNDVAAGGQRELLSLGRYLFANVAPLQNAITTIANTAIGSGFIPQYYGRPQGDWGERAESLLFEWHKICVISGGVYDWRNALRVALISIIRDGDVGVLLTKSESAAYPQIQLIPAHRIGSTGEALTITDGEFAGNFLVNGAILNPWGRTVGWRSYDASGSNPRDLSGNDLAVYYRPDFCEQTRGTSQIAAGIRDWQDRKQAFEFLRLALKKEASYAVVEHTEEGALDPDADEITASTSDSGTIYEERVDGGSVRVFKAGSQSKVEFPESNRPSQNSQAFWERVTRDGLQAIGWPIELTYDASKIGGASLRMVMEVAQRTISEYQYIAQNIATRIDAWRIAKAIKEGELSLNPDWWKISHQTPEQLTADKGYSSQVDREEYKLGFTTLKDIAARRGRWWEEERAQQEAEADDLLTRAKALAEKHGVSIEAALSLLQQRSPNPPSTMTPQTELQTQ
jgi:hypothetical protein